MILFLAVIERLTHSLLMRGWDKGDNCEGKKVEWGKCERRKDVCKDGCMQAHRTEMGSCPVCVAQVGVLAKKNSVIQLGTKTMYLVFDDTFIVDMLFFH